MGICAGAIVASTQFRFTKNAPSPLGQGWLNLYEEMTSGPGCIGENYPLAGRPTWQETVRACELKDQNKTSLGKFFWDLGPHFNPKHPKQTVVANYLEGQPAIVSTQYGCGSVVLSGVHPEIVCGSSCHPEIQQLPVFEELSKSRKQQETVFTSLCTHARLPLKDSPPESL